MSDIRLREQLVRFVDWDDAHVGFDKAIGGIPLATCGARAPGFEHTVWQLLEHLRIAQADILDFCVNAVRAQLEMSMAAGLSCMYRCVVTAHTNYIRPRGP